VSITSCMGSSLWDMQAVSCGRRMQLVGESLDKFYGEVNGGRRRGVVLAVYTLYRDES